jgi:hypothetical protein
MDIRSVSGPLRRVRHWATEQQRRYAHGEDRPLGGYVVTMSTYTALVGLGFVGVRASGRQLPDRFDPRDLALLAVAVHKTARLIAKDSTTSPLRAPVTRFDGPGGPSEVNEEVRAEGVGHAIGELVTCPFCVGQWLATAGMFGLVLAPRPTRFVASTMTVVAVADALQFAYAAAQDPA